MGRKKAAAPPPALSGRTFVFGTFLNDLSVEATRSAIATYGGTVEDTLGPTTSFLVIDRINPNKKTKLEKDAQKLNAAGAAIQVLDRAAFLTLVGLAPSDTPAPAAEPAPE